jgi:predicted PurR-regulated permease PerM
MDDTRRKSLGRPVLYALIALGTYLAYLILRPFLVALTSAVILAIVFRGMQVWLASRIGASRAALVTTLVVMVAIVAPAVALISTAVREVPHVTDTLTRTSRTTPPQVQRIWKTVRAHSPVALPEDPADAIAQGAQRTAGFVASHAGGVVADVLGTLGNLVAMLFALYFMLRDGDAIHLQLRDRLPFPTAESDSLLSETRDLVVASVGAGIVVAIAQGAIGALAFRLVGIDAPVFWGLVMGFASLLPVVGATIVWVPATIVLLLSGAIGRGVALLLMGIFGISMADNILRPLLLTGKTSVSGFVIFFGLLGGAAAFGFVGLVIGPIILVITARLFESLHHPDQMERSGPTRTAAAAGS